MDVCLQKSDQISIVSIVGCIDASTAGQITDCLAERINSDKKHLVLDHKFYEPMSY
jgi:anti-anti-sigma regulatory factor